MSTEDRAIKWLVIVKEDLSVAEDLFKTGHWLYVAFMCHQVIERLSGKHQNNEHRGSLPRIQGQCIIFS